MKLGFYPVLGKSDFVRSKGKKIPIWQWLEYQPVGWLYSLAIKAEIVPDSPIIHDCGAFNYRDQDIPILNGKYVDAYWSRFWIMLAPVCQSFYSDGTIL